VGWFDQGQSWAQTVWFSSLHWEVESVNIGPRIVFTTQQLLFVLASVLANSYILKFHWSVAPHPKFSLSFLSRFMIRLHVLSGTIGVTLPLYVFFTTDEASALICMYFCCAFEWLFSLSAFIQTPNVFGVRILTVPLYYVAVLLKVIFNACLLQSLILEPYGGYKERVTWLWCSWVMHQTYAWVRVWYIVLILLDTELANAYTLSVTVAGAMCIGAIVGFHLYFLFGISFVLFYFYLSVKGKEIERKLAASNGLDLNLLLEGQAHAAMWKEATFYPFAHHPEKIINAVNVLEKYSIDPSDPRILHTPTTPRNLKAKIIFDFVNSVGDDDEAISIDELAHFLMEFGVLHVAQHALKQLQRADIDQNGMVDRNEFEESFENFYVYAFEGLISIISAANKASCRNRLESATGIVRHARSEKFRCPFAGSSSVDQPPEKQPTTFGSTNSFSQKPTIVASTSSSRKLFPSDDVDNHH
jgi:hypothetical protein